MDIFEFVDMVDYKWEVYHLEYNNEEEKKVTAVYWRCKGQYEQYQSVREGIIEKFSDNGEEFIPYEDLTEEKCVQWVRNTTVNFNQYKVLSAIAASILDQMPKEYSVPWEK